MNEIESRLSEAMKARADAVEPHDEDAALGAIARRVDARRNRAFIVLGVAAAIAIVVGAVALLRRDDDKTPVSVTTASHSTTTSSGTSSSETTTTATTSTSTTSTTTSTAPIPPGPAPTHVWPLEASSHYIVPKDAAADFVIHYLGMVEEGIGATTIDGDRASVEFFANGNGAGRMVVDVVRNAERWYVTGARADEIVVDTPQPYDAITSPMQVSGRSVAFEAQLGLELRPIGSTTAVTTGTAMGGSTEMQPFSTTLSPPVDGGPLVLIVFEGDARGAQTYAKATVVLVGSDR